jgi:hypothetical protein
VTDPYDENGWHRGVFAPPRDPELTAVFLPLSPVRLASFELGRALLGLGAEVETTPHKHYPSGAAPLSDRATLRVSRGARTTELLVTVVPAERASEVVAAALSSAVAAGGQGLDALVQRARSVVFVHGADEAFARAWLGPIRVRAGRVIGPKTALELLDHALSAAASP